MSGWRRFSATLHANANLLKCDAEENDLGDQGDDLGGLPTFQIEHHQIFSLVVQFICN